MVSALRDSSSGNRRIQIQELLRDFPSDPVDKTVLPLQGYRFDSFQGTKIPHAAGEDRKKEERNIKKLETRGSSNCNTGEEGVKKRLLIIVILT